MFQGKIKEERKRGQRWERMGWGGDKFSKILKVLWLLRAIGFVELFIYLFTALCEGEPRDKEWEMEKCREKDIQLSPKVSKQKENSEIHKNTSKSEVSKRKTQSTCRKWRFFLIHFCVPLFCLLCSSKPLSYLEHVEVTLNEYNSAHSKYVYRSN